VIAKGEQRDGDLEQALQILARRGALEATRADALTWSARARDALDTLPSHPLREMLIDLADFVVARVS
jgi:octaprenyl-diphosphate synthase